VFCRLVVVGRCILIDIDRYLLCFVIIVFTVTMISKQIRTELACQTIQEFETQASSDLEPRNNKIDELNRTTDVMRNQLTAQQKVIEQHKKKHVEHIRSEIK